MKALPILVITNALALALVAFLWIEIDGLKGQGSRSASSSDRRGDPVAGQSMDARLGALERALAAKNAGPSEIPAETADSGRLDSSTDGASATPAAGHGDAPVAGDGPGEMQLDPAEMNVFRRKVRKAQELNTEEDRFQRVVDNIDRLVQENRIAPLNDKQKRQVATTMDSSRRKVGTIWRRMRELPREMPREERGKVMREEWDNLRVEVQRELEVVVPAADAEVILTETMRGGDTGGRMWRGSGGATNRGGRNRGGR